MRAFAPSSIVAANAWALPPAKAQKAVAAATPVKPGGGHPRRQGHGQRSSEVLM